MRRLTSDADQLAHKWVKVVLRTEMMKYEVTYDDLATRLAGVGVVEEGGALRNRASRGTFSAAFLLQCLAVIGTKSVNVVEFYDFIHDARTKVRDSGTLGTNGVRQMHAHRTSSDAVRSSLLDRQ